MTSTQDSVTQFPGKAEFLAFLADPKPQIGTPAQLAVIIADIKGLGNLNLRHGVSAGDEILRTVARYLKSECFPGSLIFRRSGDEFVIIDTVSSPQTIEIFVTSLMGHRFEIPVPGDPKPVAARLNVASATRRTDTDSLGDIYIRARQSFTTAKKLQTPVVDSDGDIPSQYHFPLKNKISFRAEELELMEQVWKDAVLFKGNILFLEGQAGIGKTKAINYFLQETRDKMDPVILLGMAHHVRIPAPYHLIKRALSRFFYQYPEKFYKLMNKLTEADVRELFQFLPELDAERLTNLRFTSPSQQFDYALFEAILHFLDLLAEGTTLIVWFEDFHDADSGSWNFIRYLSANLAGRNILFLVSMREQDWENPKVSDHKKTVFLELKNAGAVRFHRMQPFTLEETAGYCQEFKFFKRLPAKGIEFIYQISKGNPLYIVELAKFLVGNPRVIKRIEKGALPTEGFEIPSTIQDVVLGELKGLSREELEFTRFLSVIGTELPQDMIGLLSGRNDLHVQSLIDSLRFKNVLTEGHDGRDTRTLIFSHPMIRTVVYNAMSLKKRRAFHLQVAGALEQNLDATADYALLADHYYLAAEWEKSYKYSMACALQAKQVYAYESAYQFFSRAREIAKITFNEAAFADMVQKEGEILQFLGRYDEAFKRLSKSVKLQEGRKNFYEAAHNYHLMAKIQHFRGQFTESLTTLARGKKMISNNVALYGLLLGEECWIYRVIGDYEKSLNAGREALEILDRSAPKRETGFVYNNLAEIYYRIGDIQTANQYLTRRLEISRAIGDKESEAMALNNLAEIRLEFNRVDEAEPFLDEALSIAREIGNPQVTARVLASRVQFFTVKEQSDPANTLLDEVHSIADQCQYNYIKPLLYLERAELYSLTGEPVAAEKQARSALNLAVKSHSREFEGVSYRILGEIAGKNGRYQDAVGFFDKAAPILKALNLSQFYRSVRCRAKALEHLGKPAEAEALRKEAEDFFSSIQF